MSCLALPGHCGRVSKVVSTLLHPCRSLGHGVRKDGVRNRVCIDDVRSILKFCMGFPFGENSARFCKSVWLPGSIQNFRIRSVSSIGALLADTVS